MNNQLQVESIKNSFYESIKKGRAVHIKEILSQNRNENIEISDHISNWFTKLTEFDFLDIALNNLEEIIIHSPTYVSYITSEQTYFRDTDITSKDLQMVFEYLCLKENIDWNIKKPFASFYSTLRGISVRVSLVHYSTSPQKRSKCFIRILNSQPLKLNNFNLQMREEIIEKMISEKKNLLICGSTGSGKTTFLNSLISHTDKNDHIVILEDIDEIQIPHNNTTKLLADDELESRSLNNLLKDTLRMSPKRIIIGEIRSNEVETYLLAMNTGHRGLMGTIHANSAKEGLERLALLFKIYSSKDLSYELVLKLVCSNIDYVIFLDNKSVTEVIQVFGSDNNQIYYETIEV